MTLSDTALEQLDDTPPIERDEAESTDDAGSGDEVIAADVVTDDASVAPVEPIEPIEMPRHFASIVEYEAAGEASPEQVAILEAFPAD